MTIDQSTNDSSSAAYACLHIPQFSLQCQLRHQLEKSQLPCVLVTGQGRSSFVIAANQHAYAAGVEYGFPIARAQARCGEHLHIFRENVSQERSAQKDLLALAEDLCAEYENTAPGCAILNLRSIQKLSLDPSEHWTHWLNCTLTTGSRILMPLHISLATTPDLAWLAAQCPSASFSTTKHLSQFTSRSLLHGKGYTSLLESEIDTLSLLHDGNSEDHISILHQWGVHTLGDLIQLPAQELTDRLGPSAHHAIDTLSGRHHRLLKLHQKIESIGTEQDLEHPILEIEPLLFTLHRSLSQLCEKLQIRQLACQFFTLTLLDETGEALQRRLKLPEPTDKPEVFRLLLHTYLESVTLYAPITAYYIDLEARPHLHAQQDMLEHSVKDPNRLKITLADIQNLIGEDNVGIAQLQNSHKPDSLRMTPWQLPKAPTTAASPLAKLGVPLDRRRPPTPITVAADHTSQNHLRPLAILNGPYTGKILQSAGPYPTMGEWWQPDNTWNTTEWDIHLEPQTLLRISHHPNNKKQPWKLEGEYG